MSQLASALLMAPPMLSKLSSKLGWIVLVVAGCGDGAGDGQGSDAGGDAESARFVRLDLGAARDIYDVCGAGPDLFVRAGTSILRSTDAGAHWTTSVIPGSTTLTQVEATATATIAWDAGITAFYYRSGDRWMSTGRVPGGAGGVYQPTNIGEAPDGRVYLAVKADEAYLANRAHRVVSSGDHGATWREDSVWDDGEPVGLHVLPDGGVRLFSSDGKVGVPGPTSVAWGTAIASGLTGHRMVGAGSTLFTHGTRYVDAEHSRMIVYRSDDGGQSWRSIWQEVVTTGGLLPGPIPLWARDANTVVFVFDSDTGGPTAPTLVEITGETVVTTPLATTPMAAWTEAYVGGNADALILVNGSEAWIARDGG